MSTATPTSRIARFGPFEVDVRSGELRKHGTRIRLGEQPFQILLLLMEHRGNVVSREELQARLWSNDTFVDFEHSLNSAVQRLRDALCDTADDSHWIERVPRRGYRFLAEIEWIEERAAAPLAKPAVVQQRIPIQIAAPANAQNAVAFRKMRWIAFALVIVVAGGIAWMYLRNRAGAKGASPAAPVIHSLAVLPLENLSGDASQEYFADGMTDELITLLAKDTSLRVVSRTSVMRYKGARRSIQEIGKQLNADAIVEGSIARHGTRIHVTTQLIYTPTDAHLWAESYDRDIGDIFALQRELAQAIAARVNAKVRLAPRPSKPINPAAHDAYLRGRYSWFSHTSFNKSRQYFEEAIRLQPDYAAAWSGLADSWAVGAFGEDPGEMLAKAEPPAHKALELDDSLSEAHNTMAGIDLFLKWDWNSADRETQRAIELDPRAAEPHHLRCYVLQSMNRIDEALEEAKQAIALDPWQRPFGLGYALLLSGRIDEALQEFKQRSEAYPEDGLLHGFLADLYALKGMERKSMEEGVKAHELSGEAEAAAEEMRAYRAHGYRAVLELRLARLKQRAAHEHVPAIRFAAAYAELTEKEPALHFLELAYREHAPQMVRVHLEPRFRFLHSDPRFVALVQRVGLKMPE